MHKHRKCRLKKVMIALLILVIIALVTTLSLVVFDHKVDIEGMWATDGTSRYEFSENGQGGFILPDREYAFEYKIRNGKLYIDFDSTVLVDSKYSFVLEGDTLHLHGLDGASSFILTKES